VNHHTFWLKISSVYLIIVNVLDFLKHGIFKANFIVGETKAQKG
jgi:hypothetical protein